MTESTSNLQPPSRKTAGLLRTLGLGIIAGAADDDCSAVGTYSQAGAGFGYTFVWTAPFLLPMMVTVVYLSSKLGQVTGRGLFSVIRSQYPRGSLYTLLSLVIVGNTIEAGADIGGIAAALHILGFKESTNRKPIPSPVNSPVGCSNSNYIAAQMTAVNAHEC